MSFGIFLLDVSHLKKEMISTAQMLSTIISESMNEILINFRNKKEVPRSLKYWMGCLWKSEG